MNKQLGDAGKSKPSKDGANVHPTLKVSYAYLLMDSLLTKDSQHVIHSIFADLCGIKHTLEKAERV